MQKLTAFLILFAQSLASLVAIYAADAHVASSNPSHQGLLQDMWAHMTGGMSTTQSPLWLLPFLLIIILVISVICVAYYIAFPEIKAKPKAEIERSAAQDSVEPLTPFEMAMRTLTPEERKVVELLAEHKGKYLQKYIWKESGLSRLKTHRIIVRLSERGILTLKKSGNTNELVLADWLRQD